MPAPCSNLAAVRHTDRSFKALETERNADDTKWLTFWFVYTLFSFAKSVCDYVAFIVPMYEEATVGIVIYLAFFGGAQLVYSTVLKPLLKKHEGAIDEQLNAVAQKAEASVAGSGKMFVSPDKGPKAE